MKIYPIILTVALFLVGCHSNQEKKENIADDNQQIDYQLNRSLSSSCYSSISSITPEDGLVPTAEVAFQIAEAVLASVYGKERIEKGKPFSVNLENDVWLIEGALEKDMLGGTAYVEIKKSNGEILKVIHTK